MKGIQRGLLIFGLMLGVSYEIPTTFAATTVNYGVFARSNKDDHINFYFRFNKKLTRVSKKYHEYFGSVAVYDTKIQNNSDYNVRFYFSKLWFANITGYRFYDDVVQRPKKAVVVKAHTTRIVNNSFRDTLDATYSYYVPKKKEQFVIQYYDDNSYYLAKINHFHYPSKGVGWNPTWKWTK
ncbi:hypothetical protein [Lentilactobacillus hilgardii]|uniref:Uncharacterized protein n=1 Tax=Lentilactobacillus hilgardii (strain ATCC 8290 / DSM 20176 / CCUG 30140 / JCM 1155 / KCTC 3500 / NBRC 15886 / NCIMB 8040 / NRRL B-1843 / 9) TaxID=1423757 RepID=C0XHX6_LENH9|nr:hypothetical protein [Lentilactobacillus hilgardii]EEI25044.1 hypothetical protein HMPREF0519_0837 [Lentilactobacillus hilgardii DSM 20176 = ATCC 8290]KRK55298.1 hypothetical protein FD42_GL001011 [Lentilactobacillus hilgardii DSM 20176 = ATCC 8290]TDG84932.1 hypothetical protein C5L34_001207 [Lentilactobacillus hilgardii]